MSKIKTKLFYLIIMMMLVLIIIPKTEYATESENNNTEIVQAGDINRDGTIDILDLLAIMRHMYAETNRGKHDDWILSGDIFKIGDVTENGKIDASDRLVVLRYMSASKDDEIAAKHPEWIELGNKKIEVKKESQNETLKDIEFLEKEDILENMEVKRVTNITLDKNNAEIKVGETLELKATIEPNDATEKDKIEWKSSNEDIVTVATPKGGTLNNVTFHGYKAGKATITATCDGKSATCEVTVKDRDNNSNDKVNVTNITLDKTNAEIKVNDTGYLRATIEPNNATERDKIEWKSSNEDIVTVATSKGGTLNNVTFHGYKAGKATITATCDGKSAACDVTVEEVIDKKAEPSVEYEVHVEKDGWLKATTDGKEAGTTGKFKRIEAIKIKINNNSKLDVLYKSHIEGPGWEKEFVKNGEISGTTGKSKRLEAVQIKLSGEDASKYDIYYSVHASGYGWLNWAKNGETAGTTGIGRAIEAIKIKIVKKDQKKPIDITEKRTYISLPEVKYKTHIQTDGWQKFVKNGATAGTTRESKRMEAIQIAKVNTNNTEMKGSIKYRAYVQGSGWQKWVKNGATAGTTGKSKRMEAIQIKLTGELEKYCNVYYRAYVQGYGWLGWAKNGETAGSTGISYRMEAIQIKIVKKADKINSKKASLVTKPMSKAPEEDAWAWGETEESPVEVVDWEW